MIRTGRAAPRRPPRRRLPLLLLVACAAADDGGCALDSTSWYQDGHPDRGCEYVGAKPWKRCDRDDAGGVSAYVACACSCATEAPSPLPTPLPTPCPAYLGGWLPSGCPTGASTPTPCPSACPTTCPSADPTSCPRAPDGVPDGVPDALPRERADGLPREQPDGLPDGLPDALPGERADGLPREQPDGVPDGVPELVPHEDADALPDDGAARARADRAADGAADGAPTTPRPSPGRPDPDAAAVAAAARRPPRRRHAPRRPRVARPVAGPVAGADVGAVPAPTSEPKRASSGIFDVDGAAAPAGGARRRGPGGSAGCCVYRARRPSRKPRRDVEAPPALDESAIEIEVPSVESRRRLVADDALDFDAWDYEGGDRDSESKSQRTTSRAGVTSYVARRRGRIVTWEPLPDGSVSAKVVWASTDRYAHALVRQLTLPAAESKRPPALGVRDGECLSLEAASRGFELPGGAALSPELRAAIERADMWPFRQRLQAVRDYLNAARVPYATGRVELKVKRGDCYGGCLKAFKKLAPKAWRMSWFLKFDGEGGLDAGGLSRDFWRLCLSRAFDEDLGLFRRSDVGAADARDVSLPRPRAARVGPCVDERASLGAPSTRACLF
ncbi:hypothetical protein JL721_117 [Aureococcus anophagefferens]|nr:hypothetical protein JL721_117 [Aureococcus anophagefferens]